MKIRGVVKKHLGRGTKLGFPTANLEAPEGLEEGIYAGLVNLHPSPRRSTGAPSPEQGESLKVAIAFLGAAETFGEREKKLEVHILDFDRDLYGQEIEVQLLRKIRDNIKFNSQDELVAQMREDERAAREFFRTYGRVE